MHHMTWVNLLNYFKVNKTIMVWGAIMNNLNKQYIAFSFWYKMIINSKFRKILGTNFVERNHSWSNLNEEICKSLTFRQDYWPRSLMTQVINDDPSCCPGLRTWLNPITITKVTFGERNISILCLWNLQLMLPFSCTYKGSILTPTVIVGK